MSRGQAPRDTNGNLTSDGVRSYTYDHANRLTQVTEGSLTTQFAYNGDGVRTSKAVSGDTTQYVLDLAATLPVVTSDTDTMYLYGLDAVPPSPPVLPHQGGGGTNWCPLSSPLP